MKGGKDLDIGVMSQLINSLEEVGLKLEKFYNEKNYENFNKSKKLILNLQEKILEEIK
jgi:hypothetical protein